MCHIGKAGEAWRICHANTHMLQVVQVPNIGLAGQCLAAGGPCRAPEVFGGPTQLEALNPTVPPPVAWPKEAGGI